MPYMPREAFIPYHNRFERFSVQVAHRRSGKTVSAINDLIIRSCIQKLPDGRAAYVGPYYNQAKDVAWNYLKKFSAPLLVKPPNESELWVEIRSLGGTSRIRIYGSDNPDRLRGLYLDDAVLDEYADMHPALFGEIIRPLLSDRKGGASFIGTPKGRNAFFNLYQRGLADERWFTQILKASESGIISPEELEDAAKDMTAEQYAQEFECSFDAAILGAYFGKEMADVAGQNRITDLRYEPDLPVHTVWDLGMHDSTAIWFFQVYAGEIRILRCYENHNQALKHYTDCIKSFGYKLGTAWIPHDGRVRELGTGKTRLETLKDLGMNVRLVPDHKIMDGINAVRLSLPRCWFDEANTRDGREALCQYRSEYDDKAKIFKNTPKHDWTSHYADSFRYLAMAWKEVIFKEPENKGKMLNEMTWDDLMKSEQQNTRKQRI